MTNSDVTYLSEVKEKLNNIKYYASLSQNEYRTLISEICIGLLIDNGIMLNDDLANGYSTTEGIVQEINNNLIPTINSKIL